MSKIHVTKEVMKAETALKRIRRNTERAIENVTLAWMQREADYIGELPEEVKRGLRACGVIGTAAPVFDQTFVLDPEDKEETNGGGAELLTLS